MVGVAAQAHCRGLRLSGGGAKARVSPNTCLPKHRLSAAPKVGIWRQWPRQGDDFRGRPAMVFASRSEEQPEDAAEERTPSASADVGGAEEGDSKEQGSSSLGTVGAIVQWGFLALLFAASIFFTLSREFLPDLVPLDMDNPGL